MMENAEMRLADALADALSGKEKFAPRKLSAAKIFRERATEFAALWEIGYSAKAIAALFARSGVAVSERTVRNNIRASASAVDKAEMDRLVREYRRRQDAARGLWRESSAREVKAIEAAPAGPSPSGSPPAAASRALPPAPPMASNERMSRSVGPENVVCAVTDLGQPAWDAFAAEIRRTKAQSMILIFNGKRGQFPLHKQAAVFKGKVSSWEEYEQLI